MRDADDVEPESPAVRAIIHGCERAVTQHYFNEIYPAEIRERAALVRRFAERLDRAVQDAARRKSFAKLDFCSAIILPGIENVIKLADEIERMGWDRL
jgi:hypothetical protein